MRAIPVVTVGKNLHAVGIRERTGRASRSEAIALGRSSFAFVGPCHQRDATCRTTRRGPTAPGSGSGEPPPPDLSAMRCVTAKVNRPRSNGTGSALALMPAPPIAIATRHAGTTAQHFAQPRCVAIAYLLEPSGDQRDECVVRPQGHHRANEIPYVFLAA
jgi:hypothetical protein